MAGKLPQRKLSSRPRPPVIPATATKFGLATRSGGRSYHPTGPKRPEGFGAVVGAAPASNVRAAPAAGDMRLLGGATGLLDGCARATGSSKAHKLEVWNLRR